MILTTHHLYSKTDLEPPLEVLSCSSTMSSNPEFRPRLAPTQGVGPDYRTESQKPTATVSASVEDFDNVTVLPQTPQLIALLTCVPS